MEMEQASEEPSAPSGDNGECFCPLSRISMTSTCMRAPLLHKTLAACLEAAGILCRCYSGHPGRGVKAAVCRRLTTRGR